jgi:glutamyl-Q tRNA(Asp) synthetase
MMPATPYIGRFAPSPTGPLHAGSLVAALASWLDARAHGGQWLVRMEDVDAPRCIAGMDEVILNQLAACGMTSDAPVVYQSKRTALYEAALARLQAQGSVYRCYCSRKEISLITDSSVYPGTCRPPAPQAASGKACESLWPARQCAYRLRASDQLKTWTDRRLGPQSQNVAKEVGDFVIKRADGLFAYQIAVVVDDLAQSVTHIVRGQDLADNTARQILLKNALGNALQAIPDMACSSASLGNFHYLHVPLVLAADGEKLSKQNGAKALDLANPLRELNLAAARLGLQAHQGVIGEALMAWTQEWRKIWP